VFGISGSEFLVLLLVVIVVVGPRRLPEYTRRLTQLVRRLRLFLDNAKEQIAQEVGPELGELNLEDLNPRNYDPRKIVRDALGEDLDAIRRDLANPFRSAASTAVRTGDEVVAAARGTKSLSTMIDDEAARTREGDAGGVIAAVLQTPQPVHQDGQRALGRGQGADVADNSTHGDDGITLIPRRQRIVSRIT